MLPTRDAVSINSVRLQLIAVGLQKTLAACTIGEGIDEKRNGYTNEDPDGEALLVDSAVSGLERDRRLCALKVFYTDQERIISQHPH